jgi:aminopeptidase N
MLKVTSYEIDLDLSSEGPSFPTQTKVFFTCSKPGADSFIDAITNSVHSVRLNGLELDPSVVSDGTRIALPNLQKENTLEIKATANYMNTGEGLHRFVDPVDKYHQMMLTVI